MKSNDKVHLVYASSELYLKWLEVSIASAYYWASDTRRIVVHVLTSEVDDETWNAWLKTLQKGLPAEAVVIQHVIPERALVRFPKWHGSLATYYRLLIPETLTNLEWCVYADGDTLFLDDPLKLIDLYDSHCVVTARVDRTKYNENLQRWYAGHNMPFNVNSYFNSGFLLMNLEVFRKEGLVVKMLEFLTKNSDCMYADQDALNVACFGRVKLLPKEWGVFICDAFTIGRPSLIHFVYHVPWKMLSLFPHDYYDGYRLWFTYAKRFFNKSWREIVVDPPSELRYVKMRMLGWALSVLRACLPDDCSRIPVVGRYLYRHYATRKVWRSIIRRA